MSIKSKFFFKFLSFIIFSIIKLFSSLFRKSFISIDLDLIVSIIGNFLLFIKIKLLKIFGSSNDFNNAFKQFVLNTSILSKIINLFLLFKVDFCN